MYLKKKTIICIVLCIWIVLMAVVFAIYQERLTITGTTHIDSNWDVRITNISYSDIVGDATEKTAPSYTNTTARLHVSLINPTDSITYNITVKNNGTLDARIKKIDVDTGSSDAIEFEVTCKLNNGSYAECNDTNFKNLVLEPNDEQMLKIKITFKRGYIGDPSSNNKTSTVKLTIDYVQNFEDNGTQILPPEDRAYVIGDVVSFAGSNWYVIEDSPSSQDYVVLFKKDKLTVEEIGNSYSYKQNGRTKPEMAFYWSETCHNKGTYGLDTYDSQDISGCTKHNDYEGSMIKEVVDNYVSANNMANDLKEVDGYKIRLITLNELRDNLGWVSGGSATIEGNDVPTWVYGSDVGHYWTSTPNTNFSLIL